MHGLGRDQRVLNSLQVMITRREHGQHLSHAVREARGAEWPAGTRPLSPHAHLLQPLTLVKMSPGAQGHESQPPGPHEKSCIKYWNARTLHHQALLMDPFR